jgi:hypothetical protein
MLDVASVVGVSRAHEETLPWGFGSLRRESLGNGEHGASPARTN